MRTLMSTVLLCWSGLILGCGEEKPRKHDCHPVRGKVEYEGKPAVGVHVYLFPTSAPTTPEIPANPHGVTGEDGTFAIGTYDAADGAPAGGYKVILLWPKPKKPGESEETEDPAEADRLLGWYDGVRTKLSVQVQPGENSIPVVKIPAISKPPEEVQGVPGMN